MHSAGPAHNLCPADGLAAGSESEPGGKALRLPGSYDHPPPHPEPLKGEGSPASRGATKASGQWSLGPDCSYNSGGLPRGWWSKHLEKQNHSSISWEMPGRAPGALRAPWEYVGSFQISLISNINPHDNRIDCIRPWNICTLFYVPGYVPVSPDL